MTTNVAAHTLGVVRNAAKRSDDDRLLRCALYIERVIGQHTHTHRQCYTNI